MKNTTFCGTAPGFCTLFRSGGVRNPAQDEPPLRSDLFSADQMELHGQVLAKAHQVRSGRARDRLLARLAENEALLLDVHRLLTLDVKADRRITPAGEWLLDNFYVIEEQIRTAGHHLPKGYSRELPSLTRGASAGLPRVYDLALETIAHGDGRVDPENLRRFVAAYQSVAALTLGELWAIPIMLRLTLIENLRRMAARIAGHRLDRNHAEAWADKMTAVAAQAPQNLILAIADMARSNPPMVSSFVAELTRRLHGQGPALALPLTWIEQRLSESGLTSEELVRTENQQQAADQVSISNSIGSLRALGAMDWRGFVEAISLVEQTLAEDPAGIYAAMDFATRDRYRHAVERTAKASPLSEGEVARLAIGLAQEAAGGLGHGERAAHVGFFLIDEGLAQLERAAQVRSGVARSLRAFGRGQPLLLYCGAILLLTVLFAAGLAGRAASDGVE
ncbi:MAG: cyclic beta 1-2 glucan synthetase, partial [Humidesulfovibrio sp.]|nr:cyclic beta 1-2 glucan synthetase [Humidesulfovibrio sp.]